MTKTRFSSTCRFNQRRQFFGQSTTYYHFSLKVSTPSSTQSKDTTVNRGLQKKAGSAFSNPGINYMVQLIWETSVVIKNYQWTCGHNKTKNSDHELVDPRWIPRWIYARNQMRSASLTLRLISQQEFVFHFTDLHIWCHQIELNSH